MYLIPSPRKATYASEAFAWNAIQEILLPANCGHELLLAVLTLADDFQALTGKRIRFACGGDAVGTAIRLELDATIEGIDAYRLRGCEKGVLLQAASETGLFYGIQTLRQMLRQGETRYPKFDIEDCADYAVRGFYHDATRGAVPALETLFQLVDKMAFYKMNHLQLYIEHTFAFAKHADIWEGADPLTAEEILRLQDYCEERHVELVPSISTFGHCYMAMRSKRLEDLNELNVKGSERPYSFRDRMAHDTLNPSDPRSIQLVGEILGEFLPLFKSKYCNICCDETFDLGKGKNAPLVKSPADVQNLYVTFLKKIMALVTVQGKIPMFWGDIIGDDSDLIRTLPEGVIPLEWDYGAEANRRDTAKLSAVTQDFWVCPGTSVWNRWLAQIDVAQLNILNYAKKGLQYGAKGFLNTNWGDFGNINLPATSWHGMAYGAACSWNANASEDATAFGAALDKLEFGATGLCDAWMDFAKATKASWCEASLWVDSTSDIDFEKDCAPGIPYDDVRNAIAPLQQAFAKFDACLANAHPQDPYACAELRFGAEMTVLMHKLVATMKYHDDKAATLALADEFRQREMQFSQLWHKRNKPSEYYRLKDALLRIARKLDAMGV